MKDLVSIICPNFNSEKYLASTINSVITQTHDNWEFLIIDDGSSDGSLELISQFVKEEKRIKLLTTPSNTGGPAGPRNIGLEQAKGEWIAFIDSDDIWHPQKLQFQLTFAVSKNASFISTYKQNFRNEKEIKFKDLKRCNFKLIDYPSALKNNLINTSSTLIKKDLIASKNFDTAPSLIAVEDYDLWLTILKEEEARVFILKEKTIFYRLRQGNISASKFKQAQKVLRLQKRHSRNRLEAGYYFVCYAFLSIFYLIKAR